MYKQTKDTNTVQRISDGASIRIDLISPEFGDYMDWLAEGNTPTPADLPTIEEITKSLTYKVQQHLDKEAQKLGYDNIISACSYAAGTTTNKYKTDGISFLNWRSNVWDYCYALLVQVQAGTVPIPTQEELIQGLPVRV